MQRSALIGCLNDTDYRPEQDPHLYLFWRWIFARHFPCIVVGPMLTDGGSHCENSQVSGNLPKCILTPL